MTEEVAGNSRWWFPGRESAASARLRPEGFAVTVFVQTRFERKLVGRPGFKPGTTGLKVHWEFNGDSTFQHTPGPILARLEKTKIVESSDLAEKTVNPSR